jgi:hypothetical protein
MLAYARHEARMREPVEGTKHSVRAHLEAAAERGSESAAQTLAGPEIPEALEYLWEWFSELDGVRTFNGMNGLPEPITYAAIDAWARLTGRSPTPEEVQSLVLIDGVFRQPKAEVPTDG